MQSLPFVYGIFSRRFVIATGLQFFFMNNNQLFDSNLAHL